MAVKMKSLSLTSEIVSAETRKKQSYSVTPTVGLIAEMSPWPRDLEDGSCKGYSRADVLSNPLTDEDLIEAKSVCLNCPIRTECYSIGVARADEGVYGGVYLYRGKPDVLPKYRYRARKR